MLEVRCIKTLNTNQLPKEVHLSLLQNIIMPTINQLIKKSRTKPVARNKVPALEKQPLKRCHPYLHELTFRTFCDN